MMRFFTKMIMSQMSEAFYKDLKRKDSPVISFFVLLSKSNRAETSSPCIHLALDS